MKFCSQWEFDFHCQAESWTSNSDLVVRHQDIVKICVEISEVLGELVSRFWRKDRGRGLSVKIVRTVSTGVWFVKLHLYKFNFHRQGDAYVTHGEDSSMLPQTINSFLVLSV